MDADSDTKRAARRERIALAAIVAVGLLALSPGLRAPFWLDDYAHISMVAGTYPGHRGPTELYDFVSSADRGVLIERGVLPWWTDARLELRFFRPLASASLYAEHLIFGSSAGAMHAVSVAWWLTAVLAARALYRRLMPARVALLATAFFALAPCHAVPLGWIASRTVVMSLALGALGLGAHVRFRERGLKRHAALAVGLFSASLASGEYGLAFGGYVLAFELFRAGAARRRLAALLTFAGPASASAAARAALHYGTAGSGFYLDPTREPLRFLAAAPRRVAVLLIDAWLTADADSWGAGASAWAVAAVVLATALALAGPLSRAARALADEPRNHAKWLILGSFIALVPTLAVTASMRLVGASVLGLAPAVAALIEHGWFGASPAPPDRRTQHLRAAAALMAFAHLVHAPVGTWIAARQFHATATAFARRARWLREHIGDAPDAEVIVARGDWQSALFGSLAIAPGRPPIARWRPLVMGGHALLLRRDDRTLDAIIPHGRGFFPAGREDLFRGDDAPLVTGDEITIPGLRVTLLDAGVAGPARLRFVFDRSLEDRSLTWITELSDSYREAPPPAPGFGTRLDP